MSAIARFVVDNATRAVILVWDVSLTIINILSPSRRVGSVIPHGRPGAGGKWPEYIAPGEGDSRSACPGLNALANHGILPRDGRNISFRQMNHACRATFNLAPTFCFMVPNFSAKILKKSYWKGTFDLADLNVHNGIEHDASLTRQDTAVQPDQSKPHEDLVQELLSSATGKNADGTPKVTLKDLSKFTAKRRADSKASNPTYTLSLFHRALGSTKYVPLAPIGSGVPLQLKLGPCISTSFLVAPYGGRVDQLQELLVNEQIPDGWEPTVRKPMGLTISVFAVSALRVELGVKQKQGKTT